MTGNVCAAISQYLMTVSAMPMYVFWFVLIYGGTCLGAMSLICNDMLITAIAPKASRGEWQGKSRFTQNLGMAIGPIAFSSILGDGSNANAANYMLYACGTISLLAAFLYSPHLTTFSRKIKAGAELTEEQIVAGERLGQLFYPGCTL
jgi:hypothetical protein